MENARESRTKNAETIIDALAVAGAGLLGAGCWAAYGWPVAAMTVGSLLVVVAALAALRGGR